ncbi:MAG: hypothetical protein ACOYUZ_04435 [Patescibacteria group bacterium]
MKKIHTAVFAEGESCRAVRFFTDDVPESLLTKAIIIVTEFLDPQCMTSRQEAHDRAQRISKRYR